MNVGKITRQTIWLDQQRVQYEVIGEGEPMVLVHGLSGSTLWWRRNIASLAAHYRLYLIDLPGFGTMHRVRNRFELGTAAQWLLQWMRAVKLQRAHFVGHSMGGHICIWLAAHHPEVVDRLVLVAPAVLPAGGNTLRYIRPLLAGARAMTPSFFWILGYDALRAGPRTLWNASSELFVQDVSSELAQISAPTLLIWGEKDTLVPPTLAPLLREQIADSRLLILKGAGHVCMYDRAQEFNAALLLFLRGQKVGDGKKPAS